jgi:hypothetical protein
LRPSKIPPAIPIAPLTAGTPILATAPRALRLSPDWPLRDALASLGVRVAPALRRLVLPARLALRTPLPLLAFLARLALLGVLARFAALAFFAVLARLALLAFLAALARVVPWRAEVWRLVLFRGVLWLPDPLADPSVRWLRVLPRVACWRPRLLALLADLLDERRLLEPLEEPRPLATDMSTSCSSSTGSERRTRGSRSERRLPKAPRDANVCGRMFYAPNAPGPQRMIDNRRRWFG